MYLYAKHKIFTYVIIITLQVLRTILLTFTTSILVIAPALKNCLVSNLAVSTKLKFLPPVTQTVSIITCCCSCNSPGPQCKRHKILLPLMFDCSSFKGAVTKMWVTKFSLFFFFSFSRITLLWVHIQWYMQQVPDIKKIRHQWFSKCDTQDGMH